MKVYKVYDTEWEEIMGKGQVIEFMINQILNNFVIDDLNDKESDLYCYINKLTKIQKNIIEKIFNNEKITFKQAIEILPIRDFYIKEIEIY